MQGLRKRKYTEINSKETKMTYSKIEVFLNQKEAIPSIPIKKEEEVLLKVERPTDSYQINQIDSIPSDNYFLTSLTEEPFLQEKNVSYWEILQQQNFEYKDFEMLNTQYYA